MKKLFYPMFALATMAMTTSCSDELENGAVSNGNEATVSFKVQLEDAVGSRALGDGKTTAKYLTFAIFKAEANAIGEEVEALRQQVEVQEDLTATVSTRLVKGQTYNFVFWAQSESVPAQDDPATTEVEAIGKGKYYDISDMSTIKVNYTNNKIAANDEMRDAFYASRNNLTVKGPITETITLKRPFAQVNVGTKVGSIAESAKAETEILNSSIKFSAVATILNPYDGSIGGIENDVEYTFASIPEQNTTDNVGELEKVVVDGEETTFEYLSMNYILVPDEDVSGQNLPAGSNKYTLNNATFKIYDSNEDEPINTFEIPNLPVQRNWRTNIIGDILNETVTFNVVIDPEFDNDHNYITNEELAYVLENGGTYTMEEDITMPLEVKEGVSVVLNLNGKSISAANSHAINVLSGARLTINGEGNITGGAGGDYHAVRAEGQVIINGGTYTVGADANGAGNSCIEAKAGGEIVINAGTFSTAEQYNNKYWVLNLADKTDAKITVYGGTFMGCNPSATGTEPTGDSDNFVADGYKSWEIDNGTEKYYVVTKNDVTDVVADEIGLKNAGANAVLGQDLTIVNTLEMAAGNTIDGNGNTLTLNVDDNGTYALGIVVPGGEIKNLVIDGENKKSAQKGKGYRALWFDNVTKDVKIDNVNISGVGYTMNTGATIANGLKLTVTNSTLIGWTSYDKFASANFNNVHFGVGSYYTEAEMTAGNGDYWNGCLRPYVTTYLNNCTFQEGFVLKLDMLAAGATITLKNCMVGNQVVNADNIQTLLGVAYNDATIKF